MTRNENGRDNARVQQMVASQPGALEKIDELVEAVKAKGVGLIGCRSGHHRSPAVACIAARVLQNTYGMQCKAWLLCCFWGQALCCLADFVSRSLVDLFFGLGARFTTSAWPSRRTTLTG